MSQKHRNRTVAVVAPRAGMDWVTRYRVTPVKAIQMIRGRLARLLPDGRLELIASRIGWTAFDAAQNEGRAIWEGWLEVGDEPNDVTLGDFIRFVHATSPYRFRKR